MIKVRLLGHIRTSTGKGEVFFDEKEMSASDIVERLRSMSSESQPGFTKYNTLAMVKDGEAFVPASDRQPIRDGDSVILIPISHGG